SGNKGNAFWTVKSTPFTLVSNAEMYCSSVNRTEWSETASASICEDNVHAAFLFRDSSEQIVEITQLACVSYHAGNVRSDFSDSFGEFLLATAGNENIGSFRDELLSCGETNSGAAAG